MTVRLRTLDHARVLTRRETDILKILATGKENAEIARELYVAESTVKFHLSRIYSKLGVKNRTEAVRVHHATQAGEGRPCPTCGNIPPAPVVIVNDVEYVPKAAT